MWTWWEEGVWLWIFERDDVCLLDGWLQEIDGVVRGEWCLSIVVDGTGQNE